MSHKPLQLFARNAKPGEGWDLRTLRIGIQCADICHPFRHQNKYGRIGAHLRRRLAAVTPRGGMGSAGQRMAELEIRARL